MILFYFNYLNNYVHLNIYKVNVIFNETFFDYFSLYELFWWKSYFKIISENYLKH